MTDDIFNRALKQRIHQRGIASVPEALPERKTWSRQVIDTLRGMQEFQAEHAAQRELEARRLPPPATAAEALRREIENLHHRPADEPMALNDPRLLDRAAGLHEGDHES